MFSVSKKFARHALVMTLALSCVPPLAADSGYSLGIGAEYSRGDYGGERDIDMFSMPITLAYREPRYGWSLSVPYLRVSGPGDFVVSGRGAGPIHTRDTPTPDRTDSGLGDVEVSGTVRLWEETHQRPWVALTGKVKLATADERRRLGTGEHDYALQLELAKESGYGYIGYLLPGDPPGVDYHNLWYGLAGIGLPLGEAAGGVDLYAEEAMLSGRDGKLELSLYLSRPLDRQTQVGAYLLKGLSDASPEWGLGVSLRFALD
jgi:hypothetical protein